MIKTEKVNDKHIKVLMENLKDMEQYDIFKAIKTLFDDAPNGMRMDFESDIEESRYITIINDDSFWIILRDYRKTSSYSNNISMCYDSNGYALIRDIINAFSEVPREESTMESLS